LPALIAGAIAISFSPIFARISELGPTATAFHRVLLATPMLWAFLAYTDGRAKSPSSSAKPVPAPRALNRREFWLLVFAGVAFAGDLGFWHWSIKLTSVANSTLLANLAPIFVTPTAWLIFRERIRGLFLIALLLALGGVTVMVRASFAIDSAHVWGDALGIITAVFYAAYLVSIKLLRESLSTLRIMAWSTAITAICLFPVAIISGNDLIAATWAGWAVLIGIAWFSHIGGQGLIAFALAHLPAAFSSIALLVQPVAAALLAWVILGEALGTLQALGGVVVIFAIALARCAASEPATSDGTGR
jgi:drug/metabolite transporter (DMT)-like permease